MAPSGESFRNTFFFLRVVQSFSRGNLQNTTNNVTGAQEDHDRSRYAAYSVNVNGNAERVNPTDLTISNRSMSCSHFSVSSFTLLVR